MKYCIGSCNVDSATHEISHNGQAQKVEPRVFRLLLYMLNNPVRVISYDELIAAGWESRVVSNSSLNTAISAVRRAIGDTGSKQKCIKTVSGVGYRFTADFTFSENSAPHTIPTAVHQKANSKQLSDKGTAVATSQPLELPDRPSLAVMDFVDIGTSNEGAMLAYGLTVDINTKLARLPHLFVIARASAARFKNGALQTTKIGQLLGVRYLVYGYTQYLSKRVRITFSVVDADNNTEIWSEHFDRSKDDLFQVQDEITQSIIANIDSTIEQAEIERTLSLSPANLNAWELYHRGMFHIDRPTPEDISLAQQLFEKAISLDHTFARAYAGLSIIHTNRVFISVEPSVERDMNKAFDYARQAIDCCRRDALGHWSLGKALFLSNQHLQAAEAYNEVLLLNPNYAHGHLAKGVVSAHAGSDAEAISHLDQGQRLSPFDPLRFALKITRAVALAHQGKYDEAVSWSLQATDDDNAYFATYAVAASCLELANQSQQAKLYAARALDLQPDYSVEFYQRAFPHANEAARATFTNAMLRSGVPKTNRRKLASRT